MATIFQFPTAYPPDQWHIRRDIERLVAEMGMTAEEFNRRFLFNEFTWESLPGPVQPTILTALQEGKAIAQYRKRLHGGKAQAKTRKAAVYVHPQAAEAAARLKREKPAPASKKGTPKQAAPRAAKPAGGHDAGRKRLIRNVQMAKRRCMELLPGFDDEAYRAILNEHYGAGSSTELKGRELTGLLLYLQSLPLKSADKGTGNTAPALLYTDERGLNRCSLMKKIQALLADKGRAEGTFVSWNYALGILKRMTGGVVSEWDVATPGDLKNLIAALAYDAGRNGRNVL